MRYSEKVEQVWRGLLHCIFISGFGIHCQICHHVKVNKIGGIMKFLALLVFFISCNVFAESYKLGVSRGIEICSDGMCRASHSSPMPAEIKLDENGLGEHWLYR